MPTQRELDMMQLRSQGHGAARGLSLLELVMVLLIIGVLSGIAIPRYGRSLARHRLDVAAERIVRDLEYARRAAIDSSTSRTVRFAPAIDTYSIDGVADLRHGDGVYTVELAAEPYKVVLVSTTLDAAGADDIQAIIFDGFGHPDSGGTITIDLGGETRTITVDPDTGKPTRS